MSIATDPLSLVFIACFLFGLLFLIGSAILGNLGHGGTGHAAAHQFHLPAVGHGATHSVGHAVGHTGGTHVASHGTVHSPIHAPTTQQAGTHSGQGNAFQVMSYVNPMTIVLFLLGFGFFGYVFHNTTHLVLPLIIAFAGVGGLVIAMLMLSPMTSRSHYVALLLPYMTLVAQNFRDQRTARLGRAVLVVSFALVTLAGNDAVGQAFTVWAYRHSAMVLGSALLIIGTGGSPYS